MLLFASMVGMLAIGSVAFLSLDDGEDLAAQDTDEAPDDAGGEAPQQDLTTDLFPDMAPPDAGGTTDMPTAMMPSLLTTIFGQGDVAEDPGTGTEDAPQPGPCDTDQDRLSQDSLALSEDPDDNSDDWTIDTGGDEGDTLTGTEGSDFLMGYDGDDIADGGGGDDQVEGGAGDDTLSGGAGDDTLHGQEGHDRLHGDDGDDDLYGHDGDDTLTGGAGEDSLVGGQGDDVLRGGADADALHGYHGDDTLTGGDGADTLFGGIGDDVISGLMGDGADDGDTDYLNGGDGDDRITAGAGDVVTGGDGGDTVTLGGDIGTNGMAEIMDFTAGEDSLVIEYDPSGTPPEIEVTQDDAETDTYHVTMDGAEVAVVHSIGGLTAADVALVPQGAI